MRQQQQQIGVEVQIIHIILNIIALLVVICQFSKVAKIDYLFIFMFFFVVLVVLWFYSDFGRIFVEKYKRNNSMFIWHATNVLKLTLCPIK